MEKYSNPWKLCKGLQVLATGAFSMGVALVLDNTPELKETISNSINYLIGTTGDTANYFIGICGLWGTVGRPWSRMARRLQHGTAAAAGRDCKTPG